MRWILVTLMACLMVFGVANAGGTKTAASTSDASGVAAVSQWHKPLNNVVMMDATGKRRALCCCGAEFTVTDNAPTMDHDGTLFYLCGEGCREAAMKATKEETAKTMDAWQKKYEVLKLPDNTFTKDGKTMATCVCGAKFTVTDKTPYVTENGVRLYLCGDGCAEHIRSSASTERLTAEMKVLQAAAPAPVGKGS